MKSLLVYPLVAALMFAPASLVETNHSVQAAATVQADAVCGQPHNYIWGPLGTHVDITVSMTYTGTFGAWTLIRELPDGQNILLEYGSISYSSVATFHGETVSLRGPATIVEFKQGKQYVAEIWEGTYTENFSELPVLTQRLAQQNFATPLCNQIFLPIILKY